MQQYIIIPCSPNFAFIAPAPPTTSCHPHPTQQFSINISTLVSRLIPKLPFLLTCRILLPILLLTTSWIYCETLSHGQKSKALLMTTNYMGKHRAGVTMADDSQRPFSSNIKNLRKQQVTCQRSTFSHWASKLLSG